QSSARRTRSSASGGKSRRSSSSARKAYSVGGSVSPPRYMTLSLPSRSSASLAPRIDPSASPSGFSCVTRRKRSCARIASATRARSVVGVFIVVLGWLVGGEVVDQLRHPHPTLDRLIVFEGELRGPLELELVRDRRLEDAVRSCEASQRRVALLLSAEDADVDGRVAEIGGRGDPRDRDEPDPRVLELGDGFGQHLADRLVDAAHPFSHRDPR